MLRRLAVVVPAVTAIIACAVPAIPCRAQATDVKDLLSGSAAPLTLKLKDLNTDWRRFTTSATGGDVAGAISSVMSAMFGGAGGGGAYYTKGQTVLLAGETFLVTYRVKSKPLDFASLMQAGPASRPKLEKLTPDTTLALSLLNLRAIASLNEIRPFNIQEEIAESESLAKAMENGPFGGGGGAGDTEAAPEEESGSDASIANLKQLGLAVMMYSQDYDETLPPLTDAAAAKKAIMPYVKNDKVFVSPDTKQPFRFNAALSKHKLAAIKEPASMVLAYEAQPNKEQMRAVVFLDGHAKRVPESDWPRLKRASKIP